MKKRSTLLVVLLALVCLVCTAIGLTACDGGKKTVIKVGDTKIGTVKENVYDVEGEVGTKYVVTAKSGGVVCDGVDGHPAVLINVPNVPGYSQGSYGTFEYTYGVGTTLKFTSETEVKNVTVTLEEKTYPQGHILNPVEITLNGNVSYSVGLDYVWYSITVTTAGSYEITFTGDDADSVAVVYGDAVNGEGDYLLEDYATKIFTFEANKPYFVGVCSDKVDPASGNTVEISGTFTVAAYVPQSTQPDHKGNLNVGTDISVLSVDSIGITVTVNVTEGKKYTVTALTGGEQCDSVHIYVHQLHQGYGKVVWTAEANDSVTVKIKATPTVSNVTLKLEEEEVSYPALTVGSNTVSDVDTNDGTVYTLTVTDDGDYSFTGIPDGDFGPNVIVGDAVNEGQVDEMQADASGNYALTAGTTYYVAIYADGVLEIAKV